MRLLQFLFVWIFPVLGWAQDLHTFSNGDLADADKVNSNFQALDQRLGLLRNAQRPVLARTHLKIGEPWVLRQ